MGRCRWLVRSAVDAEACDLVWVGMVTAPATRDRRGGLAGDLLWTTLTSLAVLFGNIALSALLARRGAVDVFEPYTLAKRVSAAALPFISLGLTVGVVKFVAGTLDSRLRGTYVRVTAITVAVMVIAVTALLMLAPERIASILLGETGTALLWSVWVYTIALTANALVFAFYRAELKQTRANWTNLVAMMAIPVTIVTFAPSNWSAASLLYLVSGSILVWNGSQLVLRLATTPVYGGRLTTCTWDLLRYSVPRIPSGIAMGVLLVIAPLFARRAGMLTESSYLLAGISVAQLISASLQSFGIVLLPRVSEMASEQRHEDVKGMAEKIVFAALLLSAVVTPVMVGMSPIVIPLWLGAEFAKAVPIVQIMSFAIPGVVSFNVLRSLADGVISHPVNTYLAVAGLVVAAVGMALLGHSGSALAVWYVVGQLVAGLGLTIVLTLNLRLHVSIWPLVVGAAGSALLGGMLWMASPEGWLQVGSTLTIGLAGTLLVLGVLLWWTPARYGYRSVLIRLVSRNR